MVAAMFYFDAGSEMTGRFFALPWWWANAEPSVFMHMSVVQDWSSPLNAGRLSELTRSTNMAIGVATPFAWALA